MDALPLGLTGDGALRAAVAADAEATRMEGVRLDHLVQYLSDVRQTWVPPPVPVPGEETLLQLGGRGTPEVPEFSVCEVAAALSLSQPAATSLCADVLDLAYRLPEVASWVRNGSLPFVRARMIARRTRDLTVAECDLVVTTLAAPRHTARGPMPVAALVPMGRLKAMVEQAIVTVRGPQSQEEARTRVAQSLYLDVYPQSDEAADVAGRLAATDAARLDQRLHQVAGWLAECGDERSTAVRRAVALGLLADPDMLAGLDQLRAESRRPVGGAPAPSAAAPPAEPPNAPASPSIASASAHGTDTGARDGGRASAPLPGLAGCPEGVQAKLAAATATVLYLHLDHATGTWCEENAGVLTAAEARALVGHSNVTIRPVLDLASDLTYTGYQAPASLKEQLALLNAGYCAFPHCHRRARGTDVDHRTPYGAGGPTSSANTQRLCRKHHRAKDKGGWRVVSPSPGIWLWASPAGAVWIVTNGTTSLLSGVFDLRARLNAPTPDEAAVTHGFLDTG